MFFILLRQMFRMYKTPYKIFTQMYRNNNPTPDPLKMKLMWTQVKQGICEVYPNLKTLELMAKKK